MGIEIKRRRKPLLNLATAGVLLFPSCAEAPSQREIAITKTAAAFKGQIKGASISDTIARLSAVVDSTLSTGIDGVEAQQADAATSYINDYRYRIEALKRILDTQPTEVQDGVIAHIQKTREILKQGDTESYDLLASIVAAGYPEVIRKSFKADVLRYDQPYKKHILKICNAGLAEMETKLTASERNRP